MLKFFCFFHDQNQFSIPIPVKYESGNGMGMEAYFKHGIIMGMDGNGSHILDNSMHFR